MNNKKAQSAIEFMTTYGWAFMIILITIGTISYFTLDAEKRAPEQFTLGDVQVQNFALYDIEDTGNIWNFELTTYEGDFGAIMFEFQNPEYSTINLDQNEFEFYYEEEELLHECLKVPSELHPGATAEFICILCKEDSSPTNNCLDFLTQREKNRIRTIIKYTIDEKVFTKIKQGEVYGDATYLPETINDLLFNSSP